MKQILTAKEKVPFTQVANAVLEDKSLSFKAKGVFAYLFSKPDGWDFAADRIAQTGTDGRRAIDSALKELEQGGYLLRKRHGDGRMTYEIFWDPKRQNSKEAFQQNAETAQISNTEEESNKELNTNAADSVGPLPKADSFFQKKNSTSPASMTSEDFVLMCRGSAWRHIRLIGEFADELRPAFTTRGQWVGFGMRNMRPARALVPYTDKQIERAARLAAANAQKIARQIGEAPKWGMETIIKYLDEANKTP